MIDPRAHFISVRTCELVVEKRISVAEAHAIAVKEWEG